MVRLKLKQHFNSREIGLCWRYRLNGGTLFDILRFIYLFRNELIPLLLQTFHRITESLSALYFKEALFEIEAPDGFRVNFVASKLLQLAEKLKHATSV